MRYKDENKASYLTDQQSLILNTVCDVEILILMSNSLATVFAHLFE